MANNPKEFNELENRIENLEKKTNELQVSRIGAIRNLIREAAKKYRGEKGSDIESASIGVINAYIRNRLFIVIGSAFGAILILIEVIILFQQMEILNRQTSIMIDQNNVTTFESYEKIREFILNTDYRERDQYLNVNFTYEYPPSVGTIQQINDLVAKDPEKYFIILNNLLTDPSSRVRLASILLLNQNYRELLKNNLSITLNNLDLSNFKLENLNISELKFNNCLNVQIINSEIESISFYDNRGNIRIETKNKPKIISRSTINGLTILPQVENLEIMNSVIHNFDIEFIKYEHLISYDNYTIQDEDVDFNSIERLDEFLQKSQNERTEKGDYFSPYIYHNVFTIEANNRFYISPLKGPNASLFSVQDYYDLEIFKSKYRIF